jgi:hypothetical protein
LTFAFNPIDLRLPTLSRLYLTPNRYAKMAITFIGHHEIGAAKLKKAVSI